MPKGEVAVKFEPVGKTVQAAPGTRIVQAAVHAGVAINTPCGGHGSCGKCRVRVVENAWEPNQTERAVLTEAQIGEGFRLACQSRIPGHCVIEIPEGALLGSLYQILGGGEDVSLDTSDAPLQKRFVSMPAPSRDDAASDLERIERVLGPFSVDAPLMRALPERLRAQDWAGTVVLSDRLLIDFEPGDTAADRCVAAFDVGTTTVVGELIDLATGHRRAACSRMNPQTRFGDDVLSRILHATQDPRGLDELRETIVGEINVMLAAMAEQAGIVAERIYDIAFAGNTTMLHLLAGFDPRALGLVPFTPVFSHAVQLPAKDFGVSIHPRARAYLFPVIGGFVGGDTVACMLASRLDRSSGPTMLIDIGTNGELVIFHEGRLLATSTAAGPAFEGARIECGMRAAPGAIEQVVFGGDVEVSVIGGVAPVGLCGSALLDLVAELRRCGLLEMKGGFVPPDQLPETVPPAIRARLIERRDGPAFLLASADTTHTGASVVLTQQDVREFQLATAAIRAGATILLRHVGLEPADLDAVLIAGGFGNYLRRENAQRVGLLPPDLPTDRIHYVGNASLAGARLAVASLGARAEAERLARATEHIDLSLDPEFQMEFAMAMYFPE